MADHVLKAPGDINFLNFEKHALILKKHDEAIEAIRVEAGKSKAEAVHAVDIAKETQDHCDRDIGIMKNDISNLKDKISGLATESAVNVLTDSIIAERETVKELRKQEDSKRVRNTTIIGIVITGLFTLAGIWYKGEVDKQNNLYIQELKSVIIESKGGN